MLRGRKFYIAVSSLLLSVLIMCTAIAVVVNTDEGTSIEVEVPSHWDRNYVENEADYKSAYTIDDETLERFEADGYHVLYTTNNYSTGFRSTSVAPKTSNKTLSDREIALLDENSAWDLVSNGYFLSYPSKSYSYYEGILKELRNTNTETITVSVWYWEDPKDQTNFNKVTKQKTFAVNSAIADTFRHIFADIYNDPSQPVLNIADSGMGTWVLRGKNHNSNNTMSAHALGVAIDINPSTGSFKIDGVWYGNAYGHKRMSEEVWSQLPECHDKYHVLYDGCPIVEIFKSYGFYWGGDWTTGTDCMHLSYIGDGSTARAKGIQNYIERNR